MRDCNLRDNFMARQPLRFAVVPSLPSLARKNDPETAEGVGARLAGWASGLRYEDIPKPAVESAKRLLLDTLAVAWAGSNADGIASLQGYATKQGGAPQSRLWATSDRVPAPQAALVNGAMAAALDFDSVHDVATVHADIVVVPAVLAIAELENLDGKEFLAAYIAGDELLVRLGLAIKTHPGWFYTSVLGVFAAAAAAGRSLRLDEKGVSNAMGIALSRAAGTQQALVERATTKRLQSAFAARDGVEAALLAQCGVTAPAQMFDGQCGFESLYTALDHGRVFGGLGEEYLFSSLTLKKYASCFCNHAAIEATLDLVSRQRVKAQDAESVSVRISPFMARLVGADFAPGDNPQVSAQFSVQYSVASALLRGRFSVGDIHPDAVSDAEVGALAKRVRIEVDQSQSGKFVPATVTVGTKRGSWFEATATALPGTPGNPLTDDEHRAKIAGCFASGARAMPAKQAERLIEKIGNLENLASMRDLWDFG
jgi:2-methylcitrate dehydratase PrpD